MSSEPRSNYDYNTHNLLASVYFGMSIGCLVYSFASLQSIGVNSAEYFMLGSINIIDKKNKEKRRLENL